MTAIMTTDKKKLGIYVSHDVATWAEKIAKVERRSVSNLFEVAMEAYIRKAIASGLVEPLPLKDNGVTR